VVTCFGNGGGVLGWLELKPRERRMGGGGVVGALDRVVLEEETKPLA
jgi:hypothetical protein